MLTHTRDAETKLVDTMNGLADEAPSWRGVYFRFEQLLEQYRSDYQIQIAVNLLNDLLTTNQGGVFVCYDRSIILLCRNVTRNKLEKAIFQLRYLFMDDPLAYDASGDENPNFCRVYDLGVEFAELFQLCRKKHSQSAQGDHAKESAVASVQPQGREEPVHSAAAGTKPPSGKLTLTPTKLAHIEHDLYKADLSRVFRRQPVCAVTMDMNTRMVFDEYYIHIAHLRQMLHTDTDLLGNRWLFKYLTQLLDERMLDMLMLTPMRYFDKPLSLNFNIETLLSKKFIEFDSTIKLIIKVPVVIEIQVGDAFSDLAGFMAARNILERLGYKTCLDGVTGFSMMQIDREKLGVDLIKLQWNADLEGDANKVENRPLKRAVEIAGSGRVILCRCDTRQAVSYGQAMGINLFQGRYIDRLVNPNQKVEN